jgi:hypothetical protein
MGERRAIRWAICLIGLVTFSPGCQRADTDRLARVGHKLADKTELLSAQANNKLVTGFHTLRANLEDVGLDARVSARLRWDKALADVVIQVQVIDGHIQLSGTVPDLSMRRRAVELAESTIGVTEVVDALEITTTEP